MKEPILAIAPVLMVTNPILPPWDRTWAMEITFLEVALISILALIREDFNVLSSLPGPVYLMAWDALIQVSTHVLVAVLGAVPLTTEGLPRPSPILFTSVVVFPILVLALRLPS